MDIGVLTGHIEVEDLASSTLETAARKIEQFADKFENAFGAILVGSAAAVTALAAVSGAVIALGQRGADINDVSETLNHFAGSAGAAEEALQGLRDGTKDTVGDFDLMKTSSKLLSAGVKLTAEDFNTLGTSAFVLQNRGLGPTKDMLALVSDAMITGRTRSLQMKLGIVDVKDATQELADKLGVEVSELSKTQKAEATRTQILSLLAKANKDAGEQVRDFGEQIEFAQTQVENWFDELAQGVAASPQVMHALQAIGDAFEKTFGGVGKTAMETILDWVNKFAEGVTHYAPIIIEWAKKIIDAIVRIWETVQKAWDTVPDWFKKIALEAGLASVAVGGVSVAVKGLTGADILTNIASFATIWSGFGNGLKALTTYIIEFKNAILEFGLAGAAMAWVPGLATAIESVSGWFASASTGIGTFGAALFDVSNPVGWVVGGITLIVGGLRVLMGNFDFIMDPLKAFWQALTDAWTISKAVAEEVTEELVPAVIAIAQPFLTVAKTIKEVFHSALMVAREDMQELIFLAKNLPGPIRELIRVLDVLHLTAVAVTPVDKTVGLVNVSGADYSPAGGSMRFPKIVPPDTSELEAQAKRVKAIIDDVLLKDLKRSIADNEAALAKFAHDGVKLTADQLNYFAKAAEGFLDKGGQLGPRLAEVYANAEKIKNTFQNLVTHTELTRQTIAGVTGEWQKLIMSMAPVPESFSKYVTVSNDAILKTNQITGVTELFRKELSDLDFKKLTDELYTYGNALQDTGRQIGGFVGATVAGVGDLINAWTAAAETVRYYKEHTDQAITSAQKFATIAQGVASVYGATEEGSTGQRALSGAMAGASAGLAIGAAYGGAAGPYGAAIGAAAGLTAGAIRGMIADAKDGRKAIVEFATAFGGFDELHDQLNTLGDAGEQLWMRLAGVGHGDKEGAQKAIQEVQKQLEALNREVQRYGLTWADMWNPIDRMQAANKAAKDLTDTVKRLTSAGYDATVIASRMAGDVNDWLSAALKAGVKIPAAMEPIIRNLIMTKQLTEENARALLGLADDGVPSLEDITQATERWGIKLDDAGAKVQQLRLNAVAEQIVKDFGIMTAAGVPFSVMLESTDPKIKGMRDAIQDMVNQSLGPLGLKLPASMKPIIDKMIEAGLLTDQFGEKLLDPSKLNFEVPLTSAIDRLIDKLGELINKIAGPGGVSDSLSGIGDFVTKAPLGTAPPKGPLTPHPPTSSAGGTPETPTSGGAETSGQREVVNVLTLRVGNEDIARQVVRTLVDVGT